jgi:hypothetical protein
MLVKTIKWITISALNTMGKNAQSSIYTWLEQQAINYLSAKAPLDGNVSLKCLYYNLGQTARVASLPPDCMRISKIALKSGTRVWTLTLDNNLRIPEELFECETKNDLSSDFAGFWPYGTANNGAWWNNPQYFYGGGRNVNYYRIEGRNIIFDHNIEDGQIIIEYLSNGSDIDGDTMFDVAYEEPFRLYLISQYYLYKGTREEKSMYKELQLQYEAAQWNGNALAKSSRIAELIDAMAQSSTVNYG